jgi:hypothetical protein
MHCSAYLDRGPGNLEFVDAPSPAARIAIFQYWLGWKGLNYENA